MHDCHCCHLTKFLPSRTRVRTHRGKSIISSSSTVYQVPRNAARDHAVDMIIQTTGSNANRVDTTDHKFKSK